jgi:hypothetical protein
MILMKTRVLPVAVAVGGLLNAVGAMAACSYDHFAVGQDDGRLVVDTWQVYRHWNKDYGSNPNPYARSYYEFILNLQGKYNRVEPGPDATADPNYALQGQQGVDFQIRIQRVHASPGLQLFGGVTPILVNNGDAYTIPNDFHFHMRYLVDSNPTAPYHVMYRFIDGFSDPNEPNYLPSKPFVVHFGAEPNYHALLFAPEPPIPIVAGQSYDPNLEPNDPPAYPEGVPVTLLAAPVSGKSFVEWEIYDPNHPGDPNYRVIDANNPITLVMDQNREVLAVFKCGTGAGTFLPVLLAGLLSFRSVMKGTGRRQLNG